MKNNILIPIFILSVLFSCNSKTQTEQSVSNENQSKENTNIVSLNPEQYKVAGIVIDSIRPRKMSGSLVVTGMLDVPPQQKISISIPFGGFLKKTDLLQGTKVKKGQLLAIIENPDFIQFQEDYLETKSNYEYAKSDYERQQELASENVNSKKTLQKSLSEFQIQKARLAGFKAKLNLLNLNINEVEKGNFSSQVSILSPISGYITKINANIGMFLQPQDIMFELVDTRHLHAELTVFEKDISSLKIGQEVSFHLANETTERKAKVHLVGKEISPERTVNIHCHLEKEDEDLLPGMYLQAKIETSLNHVASLPDEAIVQHDNKNYIFIQKDSLSFEMTEIEIGVKENKFTEVKTTPDFIHKHKIVTKGAYSLLASLINKSEEE